MTTTGTSGSTFFDAWNAPSSDSSEESEEAAVKAVQDWLGKNSPNKVEEYKDKKVLLVASKKGYPKVVQQLLEDKELLKVEVDARAEELKEKAHESKTLISGFREACRELKSKVKKSAAGSAVCIADLHCQKQADYKSCYDMITLYTYICEEIPDVSSLNLVICALRDLGWTNMDDIKDHWDKVRDELREYHLKDKEKREKEKLQARPRIEPSLLSKLSEARHNYKGSWNKLFDAEDQAPKSFCSTPCSLGYATLPSLLVLLPGLVLVFIYDLVHYEEQLWLECFIWLGIFGLLQIFYALLVAPFTGWAMIKEASPGTDLGATLKGSMNMQGLVSTFLFSTIMGRLQVGLNFDLINNATEVSTLGFQINSEGEIVAMGDPDAMNATEHVLQQWCAIYACDLSCYEIPHTLNALSTSKYYIVVH